MEAQHYTGLAREAWNEAAPIHWRKSVQIIDTIRDPAATFLTPIHTEELQRIGIEGARVAQLNCNNGRELISMMRLGAASGVGFDISQEFVSQADMLRDAAGVNCTFVASDVYEIPATFDGQFDIVAVTAGAICFMPDLASYFDVAARLLEANGRLCIYDAHPIVDMFEMDRDRQGKPLQIVRSYFDQTPMRHTSGLDYVGGTTYDAKEIFYFHYKVSDIVMAAIEAGFAIEKITETGEDPSQAFPSVEASDIKPPLSLLLTLRKS